MTKRPFLPLTLFILTTLACSLFTTREITSKNPWVQNPPQLNGNYSETGQVVDIIDGDTIDVMIDGEEYRVRYIGIDTPERDEVCYNEATAKNSALVANQTVRLVQDVSDVDRYGRLLRYVYVDNLLVNAELVAGGWAESKAYRPDTELHNFMEDLESDAANAQRGCYPTGIFNK
ncbi:MAG: thermonuclease family protein [Chloroflexi bacterium]|nr:MAG: thermonuclease family protein [Chloroflexota bacterium]